MEHFRENTKWPEPRPTFFLRHRTTWHDFASTEYCRTADESLPVHGHFRRIAKLSAQLKWNWNKTVTKQFYFSQKNAKTAVKRLSCSASEMTYIVSSGALNSTHSLTSQSQSVSAVAREAINNRYRLWLAKSVKTSHGCFSVLSWLFQVYCSFISIVRTA